MFVLLIAIIYLSFISLGLPDSLFGAQNSQAMIGVQMAFAYIGGLASPLFGVLADVIDPNILPIYIAFFLAIMIIMHELMVRQTRQTKRKIQ